MDRTTGSFGSQEEGYSAGDRLREQRRCRIPPRPRGRLEGSLIICMGVNECLLSAKRGGGAWETQMPSSCSQSWGESNMSRAMEHAGSRRRDGRPAWSHSLHQPEWA